jgi:hypothetical protein
MTTPILVDTLKWSVVKIESPDAKEISLKKVDDII